MFQIKAGNLGELLKIYLRNDDTGTSSDWHLDKVIIVDSQNNEYRFPANVWLSHEAGKQLDVMLTRDTGPADKSGGTIGAKHVGAQQVRSAKIEIHNSLFENVNLKVSTIERPFVITSGYEGVLTIKTPTAEEVNLNVSDAVSGVPYYINGRLNYRIPISEHGYVEKIYINASKYLYCA